MLLEGITQNDASIGCCLVVYANQTAGPCITTRVHHHIVDCNIGAVCVRHINVVRHGDDEAAIICAFGEA